MSRLHVTAIAIHGNSTFATSQNAAPATTSRKVTSQSAAPATKKRHACIDTLPKYCACHAKHEKDLTFCDLGTPKRAFRARTSSTFHTLKVRIVSQCECTAQWQRINELATTTRRRHDDDAKTSISCETSSTFHTLKVRIVSQCECTAQWQRINELATTTRRRGDDEATTRQQNKANTGPTPDPNYKREPFATHSGKKHIHLAIFIVKITVLAVLVSCFMVQWECPVGDIFHIFHRSMLEV